MKKIGFAILLIFIILIIVFGAIYVKSKYYVYTGIVSKIDGDNVFFSREIENKIYTIPKGKEAVYDDLGNAINISELKKNDIVYVYADNKLNMARVDSIKNEEVKLYIPSYVPYCFNIKDIKSNEVLRLGNQISVTNMEKLFPSKYKVREAEAVVFLDNIKKVEILGDSELIPYYKEDNKNNVDMSILEFSNSKLIMTIEDKNEYPCVYSNIYHIYNYQNMLNKNANISEADTVKTTRISNNVIKKEIDWNELYGKLEERRV